VGLCGVIAGLLGGLAEVLWIWLYAALTGSDPGIVASGVALAVGLDGLSSPVVAGIAIHMALAAALGVALATLLRSMGDALRGIREFVAVTAALAVVWTINFFAVLPLISPEFVTVVPLGVSFVSKLLFGLAAAACFSVTNRPRIEVARI